MNLKTGPVKSREIMQGSIAVAETIGALEPGVIGVYPITPQTHIVEHLARLVANGNINSKYINADSEFSAASILYGASAAGVRSYSASSSQGLLLMTEVIFNMAGTRLPAVFSAVNRSLSPPINIQVDHQDTMTLRDSGLIQLYVESIQEAVDTHIQIFRIAEDREVLLPGMVCMDGWIISHAYEPVTLWQKEAIREFTGSFSPPFKVHPQKPLTYGALTDDDKITEFKYMVDAALGRAEEKIIQAALDFKKAFGSYHGDVVESYYTEDAEIIILAMGSIAGTIKVAVDQLRAENKKVGLLKIRSFRPFPAGHIREALNSVKTAVIIDRSFSASSGGILGNEVKAALYQQKGPVLINYIAGIGGREIYPHNIREIITDSENLAAAGTVPDGALFYNLNNELI